MNHTTIRYSAFGSLVIGALSITCAGSCSGKPDRAPAAEAAPVAKTAETRVAPPGREYQIGWSVWTGWMPFKLMEAKGFLARRAAERGLTVKLTEFPVYMDSVTAFAAGKLDGCALTAMEALQPAAAGIDTVAIVVNDTSNGGDGVLVRGIS